MNEPNDGWSGVKSGKPAVGATAQRSRTTSAKDICAFADISGDRNPIHFDEKLARKSTFGKLIVPGGVTSGILNACVAEDLPGPGTVFLNTNLNFRKAVGVGETITGRVVVTEVRDDKPICKLKVSVADGAGEVCIEGTAVTYTMPVE